MENKINTRIVPMLLELGYKDNREDKESRKIFINNSYLQFNNGVLDDNVIEVGGYSLDGGYNHRGEIDFDEIKKSNPELLPIYEELQKIIDEEKHE